MIDYRVIVSLLAAAQPDTDALLSAHSTVPGMRVYQGNENVLVSGVPQIASELRDALAPYLETRPSELMDLSAEGSAMLISTRFGSTAQLHWVERPLGARTQLTFTAEPILQAKLHPKDPAIIYYLQDIGGGEFFQIYRLDLRTRKLTRLTDGKSRHERLLISPDGRVIAYSGTGRNGKDSDVYVQSADGGEARRVFEESGAFYPLDFSSDGKRLLVTHVRSRDDAELYLVELESGRRRRLTPDERGSLVDAVFGRHDDVYAVSDRFGDHEALYRFSAAVDNPKWTPLAKELQWSIDDLAISNDGARLALNVNQEGYSRLYVIETGSGTLHCSPLPDGIIGRMQFSRNAPTLLAFSFQETKSVQDIWLLDTPSNKVTRYTQGEIGGLHADDLFEPELLRYPSTNGLTIPAFLYKPKGAGRHPVIVLFHGGPEAQMRPWFMPFVQFLVKRGFAVLLPNVRGSDGYGKSYRRADDGIKREESLADIAATFDFVAASPELDATRIGVYGVSYGGYMSLAAATFFPERVKAAVDVAGISSIPTFLRNTQPYRQDLRRAEYGDERDPAVRAVQERISPLTSVGRIRAPLFVFHGKNDPRVPQSEAEQIVRMVRDRGRPVWYLLALNEGHGFAKKENRDLANLAVVAFFETYLR